MTIRFYGIRGPHGFLSNSYHCRLTINEVSYATIEHYIQAAKTLDPEVREHIRLAGTVGEALRRGRSCRYRPDWEEPIGAPMGIDDQGSVIELVKDRLMYSALIAKFRAPELSRRLLSTAPHDLIDVSPGADYWGECRGYGKNKLGRMLQLLRAEQQPLEAVARLD